MAVLVDFRTGERVRLLRPVAELPAGAEGELVRVAVIPSTTCWVRVGDVVVETTPDALEHA